MSDSLDKTIDRLLAGYRRVIQAAHDALGPGKSQAQRNQVRESLGGYLAETTQKPPKEPPGSLQK